MAFSEVAASLLLNRRRHESNDVQEQLGPSLASAATLTQQEVLNSNGTGAAGDDGSSHGIRVELNLQDISKAGKKAAG